MFDLNLKLTFKVIKIKSNTTVHTKLPQVIKISLDIFYHSETKVNKKILINI